ncbi:ribonuclease Z [Gracilibacillus halophilus YIM-C55.5]|uniref:Ribonuclease Z n=1 Tax=Gracilibacillus halophilus YIM-C55.5 TaxID=1308866 RepID=N4WAT3_9BACI|nr:ribonuclease Z [Gracilibacillus halophilus]ENH97403.1 ribonuclease Z [Gracilibacillus halophilus YIM-C55.5]
MRVIFTGTGSGIPNKQRNVSGILLEILQESDAVWMFDCGEGTQHQILHTPTKPRKINKIFITHLHGDHIFGLPGFLSSRSFQGGESPLTIYGPKGIDDYVEQALAVSQTRLTYDIHYEIIDEGHIFEDTNFRVFAKQLNHGIPSFGFRIEEKDLPGRLLVDRLKDVGVQPGPVYKQIKENDQVTLGDGTILDTKEFIGPPKKGRVITIFGDTMYQSSHIHFAQDSDLLIHEGTFSHEQTELATQYHHSTTEQAAKLAKEANAKQLIITHLSGRFQAEDYPKLLQEARTIFPASHIAYDFFTQSVDHY